VSGCGLISDLLSSLKQPYSHTGMMVSNRYALAQAYSVTERYVKQHNLDPRTGITPAVLRYGWTGSLPQTIDEAIAGSRLTFPLKPPDEVYPGQAPFALSHPECHDGGAQLAQFLVVKPPPTAELPGSIRNPRPELEAAADFAAKQVAHYRLFAFSQAKIAMDPSYHGGHDCSWCGKDRFGGMCASFVWAALQKAKVPLGHDRKGTDPLLPSVTTKTADGLFLYSEPLRRFGAEHIHDAIFNRVVSDVAGMAAQLLFRTATRVSNQVTNCFISDHCELKASESEAWKKPGEGETVSPDDIRYWARPEKGGSYGYLEPLEARPGRYLRVFDWRK
jgi:hypothetical protein